jgi:multisubunit Na+/H+ antiporter MnhE subunit
VNLGVAGPLLGLHPGRGGDIRNMPRRVSPLRRALRSAPSFAAWWVLSMVLWLLFTSTVSPSDAGLGMCASLLAAVAGVAAQSRGAFGFRPRLRMVRRAWSLPIRVATETAVVFAALVRHATGRKRVRGTWAAIPFESGGEDPESAARRALTTIASSISPNSLVVGLDREEGVILVHQLVSDPRSVEKAV